MSGGATLLFVIALGLGGVGILYVVYYVNSIANSVTDVRAQVRREMQAREEQLRDAIRGGLDQRTEWARAEFADALRQVKAEAAEERAAFEKDVTRALDQMARELGLLRTRVNALGAAAAQPAAADDPARDAKGRPQGTA